MVNYRPTEEYHAAITAVCDRLIPVIQKAARDHGWAVAVHGSKIRDLDLLAVPWIRDASCNSVLLEAVRVAISIEMNGDCYITSTDGEVKPYGRLAYNLFINSEEVVHSPAGAHPFIDLSIVDIRISPKDQSVCTCLTSLEDDAYDPGGPMSGKARPPLCDIHPGQDYKLESARLSRKTSLVNKSGPIKD